MTGGGGVAAALYFFFSLDAEKRLTGFLPATTELNERTAQEQPASCALLVAGPSRGTCSLAWALHLGSSV